MNTVQVELECAGGVTAVPTLGEFQEWVTATAAHCQHGAPLLIHIRATDEAEMKALNEQYRNKDAPTNVLSFPVHAPVEDGVLLLGDLVMCAPVIVREAGEQDKSPAHHWAHMAVHGTLHLLGFDHQQEAEAEHMEALERAILADFDIPDPYRSGNNHSPEAAA